MSSNPARVLTVTRELLYPVTFEGAEHTHITLRRLKGKDIRKVAQLEESEQAHFLMQELSGWPPEAFDEMDGEDFNTVVKVIEGFTGKPRQPSRKT